METLSIKYVLILLSETDMFPYLTQFVQALWSSAVLLELFINSEFFQRRFCATTALRHLAFTAKKTKEIEPYVLGARVPQASALFYVSELSATKIKDMSRRALARCGSPGDQMEGKEEFEGKGKEM